jgi:hypothetical protein
MVGRARAGRGSSSTKQSPSDEEQEPEAVRLSVNLAPEAARTLKELAAKNGVSVTEMVRRAISTESFIDEQVEEGNKILIEDAEDKSLKQLVFR